LVFDKQSSSGFIKAQFFYARKVLNGNRCRPIFALTNFLVLTLQRATCAVEHHFIRAVIKNPAVFVLAMHVNHMVYPDGHALAD